MELQLNELNFEIIFNGDDFNIELFNDPIILEFDKKEQEKEGTVEESIEKFLSENLETLIKPFIPVLPKVKDGRTPKKGIDYRDWIDWFTPIKWIDYFTKKEVSEIKKSLKDAILSELPKSLSEDEINIKFEDILKKINKLPTGGGWAMFLRQLMDVNVGNPTAQQYWLTYNPSRSEFTLSTISANGVWGTITGTLSDQTDLQTALDGKLNNLIATNKLIGRWTAGTGVMEEITLGSYLSLTWNTLNVTGIEAPLTFSTGLTRTANTITNNLSTGVSWWQTVIGGTASGNSLTISSTSHATKGKILFWTSGYDEVNNWLGIGTATPTKPLHVADTTKGFMTFEGNIGSGVYSGGALLTVSVGASSGASSGAYMSFVGKFEAWVGVQATNNATGYKYMRFGNSTNNVIDTTNGTFAIQRLNDTGTAVSATPFQMSNAAPASSLIILSSGNVGLGTLTPATRLEVNGNITMPSGFFIGWGTSVTATRSIALGYNARNLNAGSMTNVDSVAIGYGATSNSGSGYASSTAIGYNASSIGFAIAIGANATAGLIGTAIGYGVTVSAAGLAVGYGCANAWGYWASLGYSNTAGFAGVAIGYIADATNGNCIAIWRQANAASGGIAMGFLATVRSSLDFGIAAGATAGRGSSILLQWWSSASVNKHLAVVESDYTVTTPASWTSKMKLNLINYNGTFSMFQLDHDGTTGTITNHFKVVNSSTVRLKNYTVATLPAGVQGDTAYVTDALAPVYLNTIVGGGAVVCPVFFDGTNWVAH